MKLKYWFLLICLLLVAQAGMGQKISLEAKKLEINRVDPPFWWAGMKNSKVELMFHGYLIGRSEIMITYPGVKVLSYLAAENPDYLYVELEIAPDVRPGKVPIRFIWEGDRQTFLYELRAREGFNNRIQGVDSRDMIYLLMPDRFANGDPANDVIEGMKQEIKPGEKYQRRGGDIQGIVDHLDYLKELGVTTLWPNPLWVNDQPFESYHGYATTDQYKVDPRFGSNDDYVQLVRTCHERGMKVIQDMVYNHIGNEHYVFVNKPAASWFNEWPEFTKTSYRAPTLLDPYASQYDKKHMSDGWFDHHMPDLNQKDPHVARYLIQNTLWWIEYTGLDGLRIDTYAYPDQEFMAELNRQVLEEYPQLHIFAETWVHGTPVQAFFTGDNGLNKQFNSHLSGVTDFQLHYATNDALTQDFGWTNGVARLYYTLAKDILYKDPAQNVTFLDNHDLGRFYSYVNEDYDKFKMGLAFLLTTRGIPCLYYGTEILMKNSWDGSNHDMVRLPFPGGFAGDKANKFIASGRTPQENDAFTYVKTLANFRKSSSALTTGKLMQFVPEEGVYVYFRYDDQQTVMVIMNQNQDEKPLDMARYTERTKGFSQARDVATGKVITSLEGMKVPGKTTWVLEMKD